MNTDVRDVYWLETHFPVDLISNGHLPEKLQSRQSAEITAFQRAVKAMRKNHHKSGSERK